MLVKPKSSHIISKFFLRLSSTLIDNVDCAILDTFNIINTNIIHCIDNNNTFTTQKSNKKDYSTIPTCPKSHAFPKHKYVLIVDEQKTSVSYNVAVASDICLCPRTKKIWWEMTFVPDAKSYVNKCPFMVQRS